MKTSKEQLEHMPRSQKVSWLSIPFTVRPWGGKTKLAQMKCVLKLKEIDFEVTFVKGFFFTEYILRVKNTTVGEILDLFEFLED